MTLYYFIAKRYLFSKKNKNVINIITGISVVAFAAVSMALIIILSALNGFQVLIMSLIGPFDPDIKITPTEGKVFTIEQVDTARIKQLGGVLAISEILEENAVVRHHEAQNIVTLKGVSPNFIEHTGLSEKISQGKLIFQRENYNYAVLGAGVAYRLSVNANRDGQTLQFFVPKRTATNFAFPEQSLNQLNIIAGGVFLLEDELDDRYVLVPLRFARALLDYTNEVSAIEITTTEDADIDELKAELKSLLGDKFEVKDKYEQQEFIYKVIQTEKWATFSILTFILVIAAFNLVGALTMLVIEKKKDIAVLFAMGANAKTIKRIFITEGILIALIGAFIGLGVGLTLVWLQQQYGLIAIGGSAAEVVVTAYPVEIFPSDSILVLVVSILIGFATSIYPSLKAVDQKQYLNK